MKKAVVIGATSGIGKELARLLAKNNYIVGLVGRRVKILEELQKEIPSKTFIRRIDISKPKEAMALLEGFIREMDGMELIVISSAVSHKNPAFEWDKEKETVDTNVNGFLAMANTAVKYFSKIGGGHIVGISSIASLMPSGGSTAYCASKAFISNYMRGLRHKLAEKGLKIYVTEIIPGFVDTPMVSVKEGVWVASPQKAARQIYDAIKKKKKKVYITKRWRIVALLLKLVPDSIKLRI